ncbi:MAG: 50S ribosomal protein L23 [Verrucomicrobiales bacterium]
MRDAHDTLKTIWLTEKATYLSSELNKYVFRVDPKATKPQIRRAVEELFGKKVLDVNTCNYAGKKKRERRADYGRRAHWKKAIVTLKEGEKIDLV